MPQNTAMSFATAAPRLIGDRLTQVEISKLTGASQSTVSRWYTGAAIPNTDEAIAIARELGVSMDALLGLVIDEPLRAELDKEVDQRGVRFVLGLIWKYDQEQAATRKVEGDPVHYVEVNESANDAKRAGRSIPLGTAGSIDDRAK